MYNNNKKNYSILIIRIRPKIDRRRGLLFFILLVSAMTNHTVSMHPSPSAYPLQPPFPAAIGWRPDRSAVCCRKRKHKFKAYCSFFSRKKNVILQGLNVEFAVKMSGQSFLAWPLEVEHLAVALLVVAADLCCCVWSVMVVTGLKDVGQPCSLRQSSGETGLKFSLCGGQPRSQP